CKIADRSSRLIIEDGLPRPAIVSGFPNSAIVDADVKHIGLTRYPRCADCPAGSERTDASRAHALIEALANLLTNCRRGPANDYRKTQHQRPRATRSHPLILLMGL